MALSLLAICAGACLGALLRWGLGNTLNALFPTVPPGTLVANLVGAYLVGVALAVFAQHDALAPQWRLFVITGFLGSLTTFSTFSAEVVSLVQQQRWAWAGAAIGAHLLGSLLMTLAGLASVEMARRWF
jgi:fluoride exporter